MINARLSGMMFANSKTQLELYINSSIESML